MRITECAACGLLSRGRQRGTHVDLRFSGPCDGRFDETDRSRAAEAAVRAAGWPAMQALNEEALAAAGGPA